MCPLCQGLRVFPYARVHARQYFGCERCGLVFLEPGKRLEPAAERKHYGTHENEPNDSRYRAFLSRLSVPLVERLRPGTEGLDYGSGPGPTLSVMLAEQGFRMAIYDPFFAPDLKTLDRTYDFVTCAETAEHFRAPAGEFDRLNRLLRPGGWLAVMTEMLRDDCVFENWHYARDPTHVCFYRPRAMEWLAGLYGWAAEFPHRNVVLFGKPIR